MHLTQEYWKTASFLILLLYRSAPLSVSLSHQITTKHINVTHKDFLKGIRELMLVDLDLSVQQHVVQEPLYHYK